MLLAALSLKVGQPIACNLLSFWELALHSLCAPRTCHVLLAATVPVVLCHMVSCRSVISLMRHVNLRHVNKHIAHLYL